MVFLIAADTAETQAARLIQPHCYKGQVITKLPSSAGPQSVRESQIAFILPSLPLLNLIDLCLLIKAEGSLRLKWTHKWKVKYYGPVYTVTMWYDSSTNKICRIPLRSLQYICQACTWRCVNHANNRKLEENPQSTKPWSSQTLRYVWFAWM